MKYKKGDLVTITSEIPEDKNTAPGWNVRMNLYTNKTLRITGIYLNKWYVIEGWHWKPEWIKNNTPPLDLNERICNKIKQLDTKWKERSQNVHCNS